MFTAIFILLAMPILDTSRIRSSAFRPFMKFSFWVFVINFLILLWLGSQHVEEPYISLGQLCTAYYFVHFLIIIPLVGILDNTLFDIVTKPCVSERHPLF